tara:strand:- start:3519 stop:4877 length:1359 start_codon:yes stop_codon:yes gene_type:complete
MGYKEQNKIGAKLIKGMSVDTSTISTFGGNKEITIRGDQDAVFSIQVKNSTDQFYNFVDTAFSSTITSSSRLANVTLQGTYNTTIVFPSKAAGDTYTIYIWAEPHFNTEHWIGFNRKNCVLKTVNIQQGSVKYIRLGCASDQSSGKFSGLYDASTASTYSTSSGSNSLTYNDVISFEETISDPSSPSFGYKTSTPLVDREDLVFVETTQGPGLSYIASAQQPSDGDFYTVVTTQTNGSGTDSTSMIVDSVDGLVEGMSLVSIADSSDLEQSGTLGVLTYPTITSIDVDGKTLTLSAAPDWGDDKAVSFRAYGSELINESTGIQVSFENFKYTPVNKDGDEGGVSTVAINGDQTGTSLAVEGISGISAGSILVGQGLSGAHASGFPAISSVHATGTPIVVDTSVTVSDGQLVEVHGSVDAIKVTGEMRINRYPSTDTVIYLDIDRGFVLGTTS